MPKYKASQVRNNNFNHTDSVTGISASLYLIGILQSIKTIVKYVIPRFLFKPLRL